MTGVPPELSLATIVATLRQAGCVFAEDEARLLADAAGTPAELAAMVARRAGGLPLEQVIGWAEFCGHRIIVAPGVFVPRRRSEVLVRHAVRLAASDGAPGQPVVLDLCCGTGAVGVSIVAGLPGATLHAVDIDPAAVSCARRNIASPGRVYQGDLFAPLPASLRGRVDILVANAPYVPTAEIPMMPAEARLYEPQVALDGGADGVSLHRRVAAAAPDWLAPGGHVLIETSDRQAPLTLAALTSAGLSATVLTDEDWAVAVAIGTAPS